MDQGASRSSRKPNVSVILSSGKEIGPKRDEDPNALIRRELDISSLNHPTKEHNTEELTREPNTQQE